MANLSVNIHFTDNSNFSDFMIPPQSYISLELDLGETTNSVPDQDNDADTEINPVSQILT